VLVFDQHALLFSSMWEAPQGAESGSPFTTKTQKGISTTETQRHREENFPFFFFSTPSFSEAFLCARSALFRVDPA
jgi:hypothetical protein